jgi:arginine deiminase
VGQIHGVDSEVGQLRTVLMHRPGTELQRITPRHKDQLLFGTLPWVSRARQEHDVLSQELRNLGVEVLYFTELLQDALEYQPARDEAIIAAVADVSLGEELRGQLRAHLDRLGPEELAQVLIAGLTPEELKTGRGVVFELLDRHDFVLPPLPNLVFTKDSSFWIGDQVAVASLAAEPRRREADLSSVLYRHHPRFAGTKWLYQPGLEHVDGGDVLMLAPGVVAVGVGQRTTAAGAERLSRRLLDAGLAHAVLAVPMSQHCGGGHMDTICAVVDVDSVVMHPAVAYTLVAHTISARADGMRVSRPQPFLEAAAQAMGIERLHVIDAGVEQSWDQPGQWDDGGNVLAVGRRLVLSHERNCQTNSRLEAAGIRVIRVPSSELGSVRGGPRCMSCPVGRDPAAHPSDDAAPLQPGVPNLAHEDAAAVLDLTVPNPCVDGGSVPNQRAHQLTSAGLNPAARPPGRASPEPEEAEQAQADHCEQQGYEGEEDDRLDNCDGDQDHDDGGHDEQQHSKHAYTVRRRLPRCHSGSVTVLLAGKPAQMTAIPGSPSRSGDRVGQVCHLAVIIADQVVCGRWS